MNDALLSRNHRRETRNVEILGRDVLDDDTLQRKREREQNFNDRIYSYVTVSSIELTYIRDCAIRHYEIKKLLRNSKCKHHPIRLQNISPILRKLAVEYESRQHVTCL